MPDSPSNASIQWNRPLRTRYGSPFRLAGIRIFYDFEWNEILHDERTQFRNGRRLALLVQQDCPRPKTAALLLTDQPDQPERTIETDEYYVFVVRVRDYLASATADPAATYCARRMQTPLTRLQDLQALGTQPALLQTIIDRYIDLSAIIRWLGTNRDRAEQLRAIAGTTQGGPPDEGAAATRRALEALAALESLHPEILDLVASRLQRQALSPTSRDALMSAISAGADGLVAASAILGQRIADRVAAARAAADAFGALLENPNSNETDLQSFIEDHPWLIGLEYVKVTPKRSAPRGQLDFLLQRYDGFYDVLELKGPHDPIIEAPDAEDGWPPSPSEYALSRSLAQALAQIHVYRDALSADEEHLRRFFGLEHTRHPQLLIVIGRSGVLPEHRQRVLDEINLSLHGVKIIPYDLLTERCNMLLTNLERVLAVEEASRTGNELEVIGDDDSE